MPRFDPFVLFWVLRNCARIRSLHFVSGSSTSCPDSIPSLCFRFSSIVPGLQYLFRHCDRIFLIFLSIVFEHRLSFSASCPTFIIFSGIVTGFSSSSLASCPSIAYLFRHRVRLSPIFTGIVSGSLIFLGIVLRSLLVLQSWRLSSVSLRYWVRGQNCWSSVASFFSYWHHYIGRKWGPSRF